MEIPKNLKDEIWEYCRLNDISNIDEFIIKMVRQGYTVEKFGATPLGTTEVKEVEKIVEVIKEVPVEKIIEKEVFITDDIQITELTNKLTQLEEEKRIFSTKTTEIDTIREEFSTKTVEMENTFQYKLSLKDNEIEKLKSELESEKKKTNNGTDLYGDEKRGGWFGSNILRK
jgi:vesicle coat complex subunit